MTSLLTRFFRRSRPTNTLQEQAAYLRQVTEEYGFETVPADQVYLTFDNVASLNPMEFIEIRRGFYGRQVSPEVIHLVKLQAMKGACYTARWGVSLSFMPSHWWTQSVKYHRTLNSAQFDLFEDPVPLMMSSEAPMEEEAQVYVSTMHGLTYFQNQITAMWRKCSPIISDWFEDATTIHGLLSIANRQISTKGMHTIHSPRPQMVAAFLLARIGETSKAQQLLHETIAETRETPESASRLFEALAVTPITL